MEVDFLVHFTVACNCMNIPTWCNFARVGNQYSQYFDGIQDVPWFTLELQCDCMAMDKDKSLQRIKTKQAQEESTSFINLKDETLLKHC